MLAYSDVVPKVCQTPLLVPNTSPKLAVLACAASFAVHRLTKVHVLWEYCSMRTEPARTSLVHVYRPCHTDHSETESTRSSHGQHATAQQSASRARNVPLARLKGTICRQLPAHTFAMYNPIAAVYATTQGISTCQRSASHQFSQKVTLDSHP